MKEIDLKRFEQEYPYVANVELCERFGLTETQVKNLAWRLKLRKDPAFVAFVRSGKSRELRAEWAARAERLRAIEAARKRDRVRQETEQRTAPDPGQNMSAIMRSYCGEQWRSCLIRKNN